MDHPLPLVTVVTPSYNQGAFIRETIESVLSQDYPNVEYIVVDGGSNDGTLDILRSYGDRFHWISEKDKGQSDAINKGFRMARGEIVAWLNSDDTYEPGAVAAAVSFLREHPDISLAYGRGYLIDREGKKLTEFLPAQTFDLWMLAYYWDPILQPTTFFRKAPLERFGFLDEGLNWCMDWDLWLKFGLYEKAGFLDAFLANSREYGETKTSTGGLKRLWEIWRMLRRYGNLFFPPAVPLYYYGHLYDATASQKRMDHAEQRIIEMEKKYRTVYMDRWVCREVNIGVPFQAKTMTVYGNLPMEEFLPIGIQIFHKKALLYTYTIEAIGPFSFTCELPAFRHPGKVNRLVARMTGAKAPRDLFPGNPDDRPLSFRLDDIEFTR